MVAIFTVLAMDGYRANPDRVTALFVAVSAAVALIFAPSSFLVVALGSYVVLLLARFPVARRRSTLPHRAVHEVATELKAPLPLMLPLPHSGKNVTYVFETG